MGKGIKLAATDEIHQKLWQRKKLMKRRELNTSHKIKKNYFKNKEAEEQKPENPDDKHARFYKQVFAKDEAKDTPKPKPKKSEKKGFNQQLERIKNGKEQAAEAKVVKKENLQKKYREKIRYSNQLNRKTAKGQMRMSGMIDHYLNKLQANAD